MSVDLNKMSDAELDDLHADCVEARARRSIEKEKIEGESFDMDAIKPGMSPESFQRAARAAAKALKGGH